MTPLQRNWKLILAICCIAVFAGIFALSAQPHSAQFTGKIFGQYNNIARKAAHFSVFALAALASYAALRVFAARMSKPKCMLIAGLVSIAFAFLDELHQAFVPGRTASLYDVLIDSIGVVCMLAAIGLYEAVRYRSSGDIFRAMSAAMT